jgi:hypothetical protein
VIGPFSEKSIWLALAVTGCVVGVAGGVHVSCHGMGSSPASASSSLATSSSSDMIPLGSAMGSDMGSDRSALQQKASTFEYPVANVNAATLSLFPSGIVF